MKKVLNRFFCLFFILVLVFTVASCDNQQNTPNIPDKENIGEKYNALTVEEAIIVLDESGLINEYLEVTIYGVIKRV